MRDMFVPQTKSRVCPSEMMSGPEVWAFGRRLLKYCDKTHVSKSTPTATTIFQEEELTNLHLCKTVTAFLQKDC